MSLNSVAITKFRIRNNKEKQRNYHARLDVVEFAIYCRIHETENYDAFREEFCGKEGLVKEQLKIISKIYRYDIGEVIYYLKDKNAKTFKILDNNGFEEFVS